MKVQCLANPKYSPYKTTRRNFGIPSIALKRRLFYGKRRKNFTGKERDPETGLYFPSAPVNDGAKKRNQNLPGQGGVFNHVNLHAYHYAGNNPVKYVDPDGNFPRSYRELMDKIYLNNGRNFNLETAQDLVRTAPMYQQGGGGRYHEKGNLTFCNQATFDLAEALGFNINALYTDGHRVKADEAAKNLAKAAENNLVTKVEGKEAQYWANLGYLVIAAMERPEGKTSGHLATVRPSDAPYDEKEGPLISNVGPALRHGIKSAKDAFASSYSKGDVKF